jgi:hypothetical protein
MKKYCKTILPRILLIFSIIFTAACVVNHGGTKTDESKSDRDFTRIYTRTYDEVFEAAETTI